MKTTAALLLLSALVQAVQMNTGAASPALIAKSAPYPLVEVRGAHIHASDLLAGAASDVDLGPTPPIGSSRIVERSEIEHAFAAANVDAPKKIPPAVRVSRKTRKMTAPEVSNAIRDALATTRLPRGASLGTVRASAMELPADFHHVTVEIPTPPRRAGVALVAANVSFFDESSEQTTKMLVPIELTLPASAVTPDIAKGAPLALLVKKGLVEVTVSGVAGANADVGELVPVMLRPSGRIIRARAIDKDHAVMVDDS